METRCIWKRAKHNAFTDLIRFKGRWLCIFREGNGHAGDNGKLCLISSDDGDIWQLSHEFILPERDLRDGKLSITADGHLLVNCFASGAAPQPGQSLSYHSDDGLHWSEPQPIGDPGIWIWRTVWHNASGYSLGYGPLQPNKRGVRLYQTPDGRHYHTLIPTLHDQNGPSEFDMVFREDGRCLCLLRRDNLNGGGGDNGLLGIASPPYLEWRWLDLGERIGGPVMIELPDQRLFAAVRKYRFDDEGQVAGEWLELCQVDSDWGELATRYSLPSGGDCGYAGMVWHNDALWVSYYSSHEGQTNIYLAHGSVD